MQKKNFQKAFKDSLPVFAGYLCLGAGFGILSARIGYWMLPLNRHIFRIPRKGQALAATPIYYSQANALGLSCAVQF
jgi:hypothetical protein